MIPARWTRRSDRRDRARASRPAWAFWVLAGFLALVFATGGSSRANIVSLVVLRPVAVLVAAYGAVTLPRSSWHAYRHPLILLAAAVLLTAAHLVPLPPTIWHGLHGFELVRMIDAAAGLPDQWRPLSLVPSRTVNALWSLTIPAATLLVAIRLTADDRVRILHFLLALGGVSAAIGLLQSAGLPISLFHTFDDPPRIGAGGVFANQNHQATLLAAMLPMLAVAARLSQRHSAIGTVMRPLAAAAAVAITLLLIITGSRAGLVLGVVAILFTLFYDLTGIERLDRLPRRARAVVRLGIAAVAIGIAALATSIAARDLAFSRLETIGADLRPRLWASIVPILPDYQPWGSGIGSYVEVYRMHEPASLLRSTYSNHAHNEYLEVALTAGVPGLLLLVAAAGLLVFTLWRHRRGTVPATLFARLGATTIVILALANITDYPLRTPLLGAVFALAAMWCVGAPATGERRTPCRGDDRIRDHAPAPPSPRGWDDAHPSTI